MIDGLDPDELDAKKLFPHTLVCANRMREGVTRDGRPVPCTCPARAGRKNFLYMLRRTRLLAYVDACSKIRRQARQMAERATTHEERAAFLQVSRWAENLELERLDGDL